MDQDRDQTAEHSGAQRLHAVTVGPGDTPQASAQNPRDGGEKRRQAHNAVFHKDLHIIVVHIHIVEIRIDGVLRRHGAAEDAVAQAKGPGVLLIQIAEGRLPALGTAGAGVGFGELRRKQIADAAAHKGQEAGGDAAYKHKDKQLAVNHQGKQYRRDRQGHPGRPGHGEQAGNTHTDAAEPEEHLPCRRFAVVGPADGHGRKEQHIGRHDVGIGENGKHTGAHGSLRLILPVGGDLHSQDKLGDAVQGKGGGNEHHGVIHQPQIFLIPQQSRDQEEQQNILHGRPETGNVDVPESRREPQQRAAHQQIENQIKSMMQAQNMDNMISVVKTDKGLSVRILDSALFKTCSSELLPQAGPILDKVINIVKDSSYYVNIEGHTDDTGSPDFNWKLSTDRALSVISYFVQANFNPVRLSASGYGQYHPILPNITDQNRSMNRRVEINMVTPEFAESGKSSF